VIQRRRRKSRIRRYRLSVHTNVQYYRFAVVPVLAISRYPVPPEEKHARGALFRRRVLSHSVALFYESHRREIEWTHIGERRFFYAHASTYILFARSNTRNLRFVKSIDRSAIPHCFVFIARPVFVFHSSFYIYTILASREAEYAMSTQTITCNLKDGYTKYFIKKAHKARREPLYKADFYS